MQHFDYCGFQSIEFLHKTEQGFSPLLLYIDYTVHSVIVISFNRKIRSICLFDLMQQEWIESPPFYCVHLKTSIYDAIEFKIYILFCRWMYAHCAIIQAFPVWTAYQSQFEKVDSVLYSFEKRKRKRTHTHTHTRAGKASNRIKIGKSSIRATCKGHHFATKKKIIWLPSSELFNDEYEIIFITLPLDNYN